MTLSEFKAKYTREDVLKMIMYEGHDSKSISDVFRLGNRVAGFRIMKHYRIPVDLRKRREELYVLHSIAFVKYVNYLGLNSGEIARLVYDKEVCIKEFQRYFTMDLRLINNSIRINKVIKFKSGEARPPKQFINKYFITHGLEGGLSMKDLCRITKYPPSTVKQIMGNNGLMFYHDALIEHNKLHLPQKPCVINGIGGNYT